MNRYALFLALTLAVPATALKAQAPTAAPTAGCLPSTTLDELTKALDDAVSGPADRDRACLKELLLPEARLTPITKAEDGAVAPHVLTVDDWIEWVRKSGKSAFYERQVKVSSDTFGHLAHLWSTYELRATPGGPVQVRGVNSIQAVNDGKRWRILEILWLAETRGETVPAKYLP